MYGVPEDMDLEFLNDAELIQVCLGVFQVQFHFYPTGSISVEGGWELMDAAGVRIDSSHEGPDRPPYQLHRLLGQRVVGTYVSAPASFSVRFENGEVLTVFDNSSQFESFQIEPGGIIV